VRFIRVVLALGIVVLAAAGVSVLDDEPRDRGGDGAGYRIALETPSTMAPGVCPDYRDNADARYFWDRHAFADSLEAQLWHCGRVDTGPLGAWVVEERSDSRGGYSISAHLDASSHTVSYDWGGFAPSISLNCWRGDNENDSPEDDGHDGAAGSLLEVWLWHFGAPQRFYGEPTPVRYRFEGHRASRITLWSGHPAQAEVAVLPHPMSGIADQVVNSLTFAVRLRQAAEANVDENSGPMLEFETWSGTTADASDPSQSTIEFDLLGVERAAFPVLDACGV
jgi:hypothetical protein